MESKNFDVIIVGGSYAGLSAAMSLGRSLRKVLVIDSGMPCNRFTPHSHNFLTHDGTAPGDISFIARLQVEQYRTVGFLNDVAIEGRQLDNGFEITTASGEILVAEKLIFATGIKDLLPDVEGFADCWGKSIVHCPYCHGYEFHGQKTAIWMGHEGVAHLTPLIYNLTDKVSILTNDAFEFAADELAKFSSKGIEVITTKISAFESNDGNLENIVFEDGNVVPFNALYAGLPFEQHCKIPLDLGCEMDEKGYLKTDMFHKTSVEGVYACGDNSSPFRSVANAVASGNFTGAGINREMSVAAF